MAYFHILVELIGYVKKGQKSNPVKECVFNISDSDKDIKIVRDIALPYITGGEFFINGRSLTKPDVAKLYITRTEQTTQVLMDDFYAKLSPNVFVVATKQDIAFSSNIYDATNDILSEARTMANRNGMGVAGPTNRLNQPNTPSQRITQNFHGSAMVQNNPANSSQTMTINNNQLEIFDKLLEIAKTIPNNSTIIENINEMKTAVERDDKPTFKEKYNAFIQNAANHMTLFAPLIQGLTCLF